MRVHLYDFDVWRTWAQSQNLCCGSLRSWPFSSQQFFCFVGVLDYVCTSATMYYIVNTTAFAFCWPLKDLRRAFTILYNLPTYVCCTLKLFLLCRPGKDHQTGEARNSAYYLQPSINLHFFVFFLPQILDIYYILK